MTKLPDTQENAVKNQILEGSCRNPHEFLGMHQVSGGVIVRVYDPAAEFITVIAGKNRYPMLKTDDRGIFSCFFGKKKDLFAYKIEKKYADSKFTSADPYCFLPTLGEMDIYLFNQGEHQRIYDVMGAHVRNLGGVEGVSFAVWAPNAQRVSVVGDFNCWDGRRHPMRMLGLSGIWELFIPGLKPGDVYKFEVKGSDGSIVLKLDPYARRTELRPNNAGIVPQAEPFQWTDDAWMKKRAATNPLESPMNIYEVHLGTWGGPGPQHRRRDASVSDDA